MKIDQSNLNGHLILKPEGRLDSTTAGELDEVISSELTDATASLTIDFKGIDFISSKGLRVLVSAYRKLGGKEMILENVNESVMDVLKLSGLMKVFTIR